MKSRPLFHFLNKRCLCRIGGGGGWRFRGDGVKMFHPWGPKYLFGCYFSSFNSSALIRTSFESAFKRNKDPKRHRP